MPRTAALLALLLAPYFPVLAADAGGVGPDISAGQMLRQFDDVIFGHEHGVSTEVLLRWATAPSIALFVARDHEGAPPVGRVDEVLDEIGKLTGLPSDRASRPEQATLRLGFFPRGDFAALPAAPEADAADYDRFTGTSACLGLARTSPREPGVLEAGLIMIGSDISPELQNHCILEELVQVMGMPNDACHYQPSLFCEDDHVDRLTEADSILVRTLYDPRLKTGMSRESALSVAEEIIREALGETP